LIGAQFACAARVCTYNDIIDRDLDGQVGPENRLPASVIGPDNAARRLGPLAGLQTHNRILRLARLPWGAITDRPLPPFRCRGPIPFMKRDHFGAAWSGWLTFQLGLWCLVALRDQTGAFRCLRIRARLCRPRPVGTSGFDTILKTRCKTLRMNAVNRHSGSTRACRFGDLVRTGWQTQLTPCPSSS